MRIRSLTRTGAQTALVVVALLAAVVAVVLLLTSSSTRPPSRLLESLFQDDDHLVYASTQTVERTLDTLAGLGVDRLRITVLWSALAPDSLSATRPAAFDAADPAAYPQSAWAPYDRIVELAGSRHIALDLNLTAPGPLWAMAQPGPAGRLATHFGPSAVEFGQFAAAIGRRYSGSYVPAGASRALPRVAYWSLWNEPNQPGWLAPQWRTVDGMRAMNSPRLYRAYLDAAFGALKASGHEPSSDTILIGELAPEGKESTGDEDPIAPLSFLRSLYCVDSSDQPLQGTAASALDCPATPDRRSFVAAHPALFTATGFAHHPYSFFLPPTASMSDPNFAPLSDLSRLEGTLDAIFTIYGIRRQLPIYLTEYGYETNPPNPYRGVSLRTQSLYLNEAQYLAWADPRVRALSQFLLYDSPPDRRFPPGSPGYWSTFQTGLVFTDGVHKPSFNSYRLPIVVPQPVFAPGTPVFVWGMLRLAPNGTTQHARLEWRPPHGAYRLVSALTAVDRSGFVFARPRLPGTGAVRIAWTSPSGTVFHSRAVGVTAG